MKQSRSAGRDGERVVEQLVHPVPLRGHFLSRPLMQSASMATPTIAVSHRRRAGEIGPGPDGPTPSAVRPGLDHGIAGGIVELPVAVAVRVGRLETADRRARCVLDLKQATRLVRRHHRDRAGSGLEDLDQPRAVRARRQVGDALPAPVADRYRSAVGGPVPVTLATIRSFALARARWPALVRQSQVARAFPFWLTASPGSPFSDTPISTSAYPLGSRVAT